MNLEQTCKDIYRILQKKKLKIVFAESCTGGLVSALLTQVPGISNYFCGSFVTYRNDSKVKWLEISKKLTTTSGPVSSTMTVRMSLHALKKTPEAQISAAVTGHLGPKAPLILNGIVYTAIAVRRKDYEKIKYNLFFKEYKLRNFSQFVVFYKKNKIPSTQRGRKLRQTVASHFLLSMVRSLLVPPNKNIR